MPRFPEYQASVDLKPGSAPQVRTGAEAIGQGMQALGTGLNSAAEGLNSWEMYQARQQKYDTGLSWENLQQTLASQRATNLQNQQPGAAGLMDSGMKQFDDTTLKWLKAVPKDLREEYSTRLLGLRTAYQRGYADDEFKSRGAYEVQTNAQGVVNDQNDIGQHPDAVGTVLKNRFDQIDAMSLPPDQKLALKQQAQREAAQTWLQAKHGTDEAGAAAALGIALPRLQGGGNQAARESAAMSYFIGRGYSREQAAGIVGNLVHESRGLDVKSLNKGDGNDGSDSIGIAQWNSTRANNLKAFAAAQGKDWHDLGVQLAFVDHELNTSYSGVKQKLLAAKNPDEAAGVFVTGYERPAGSEGGAVASHGWANRRDQSRRLAGGDYKPGDVPVDQGNGTPFTAPNPLFNVFTPLERQKLLGGIETAASQEKGQVTSLVKDDIASMNATGQGVSSLTEGRVRSALGDDAAAAWLQQRQVAANFHDATKDFTNLSGDMIQSKVASLAPVPGQAGFVEAQRAYIDAQKLAATVMQSRMQDPAGAVSQLPDVKQASRGMNFKDPASMQPAIAARMQAQTRLGIPDAMQTPMTYDEAQQFLAPVNKALPGQEKAAMREVMTSLQVAYGTHADQALAYMMAQGKIDKETQGIAATLFKKLGMGQPITRDDARAFDDAQKTDASNNAVAGILGPNQGNMPTPDMGAIDMLRQNPSLASQFDQVYGAGRAAQILSFTPAAPAAASPATPVQAPPPPPPSPKPGPNVRPQSDWQPSANFDAQGNFILPPESDIPTSGSDAFQKAKRQFQGQP